jgi:hypothetical protein
MTEFLMKYGFLILAVLFSAWFIIWIILRNDTTKEDQEFKPTIWSYLFIWPLLLTRKEGYRTIQRGFSKREWIGWLIFALIALLAILFTPTKK